MHVADINNARIHYSDTGNPDAPVLVFSNSLGTDFRIWDRLKAVLPDAYRFICYDKRGHGLSSFDTEPYQMSDHVNDLAALLDFLSVKSAMVCGLSVGGLITQGLAYARPDLIKAMILCDTSHKIGTFELWNDRIRQTRLMGLESMADAVLERWFSADFLENRKTELAGWRNMLTRIPAEGYAAVGTAIRDTDYTDNSRSLTLPTLCVVGSEDGATTPDVVKSTADLIKGARFEIIEGAGHLPCIEAPEILSSLITSFARENGIV